MKPSTSVVRGNRCHTTCVRLSLREEANNGKLNPGTPDSRRGGNSQGGCDTRAHKNETTDGRSNICEPGAPMGLEPAHSIAEVQPAVNELITLMILFLRAGLERGQGR